MSYSSQSSSTGGLLNVAVIVHTIKNFKTIPAFGIIVLRIAMSIVGIVLCLVYTGLNWQSLSATPPGTVRFFTILYVCSSVSLLINIWHLHTMTKFYKVFSTIVYVFELAVSVGLLCFTIPVLVFSIFFNPIKFLGSLSNLASSLLMVFIAHNFYKSIMQTPLGNLQRSLQADEEAHILSMKVIS